MNDNVPPQLLILLWHHAIYYKRHWVLFIWTICKPILLFLLLHFVTKETEKTGLINPLRYVICNKFAWSPLSDGPLSFISSSNTRYHASSSISFLDNHVTQVDCVYKEMLEGQYQRSIENLLSETGNWHNLLAQLFVHHGRDKPYFCDERWPPINGQYYRIKGKKHWEPRPIICRILQEEILFYPQKILANRIMQHVDLQIQHYQLFIEELHKANVSELIRRGVNSKFSGNSSKFEALLNYLKLNEPYHKKKKGDKFNHTRGFPTLEGLKRYSQNLSKQANATYVDGVWGVVSFTDMPSILGGNNLSLKYSILYDSTQRGHHHLRVQDNFWLQDLIEKAIIEVISNKSLPIAMVLKETPTKCWVRPAEMGFKLFLVILSFGTCFAFLSLPATFLSQILTEKQLKLREYLYIMGEVTQDVQNFKVFLCKKNKKLCPLLDKTSTHYVTVNYQDRVKQAVLNLWNTFLLRSLSGKSYNIEMRLEGEKLTDPSNVHFGDTITDIIKNIFKGFWIISALTFGSFAVIIAMHYESSTGLKHLQIMYGANPVFYWTVNLCFDMLQYFFTVGLIVTLIAIVESPYKADAGTIIIISIPTGIQSITFFYICTKSKNTVNIAIFITLFALIVAFFFGLFETVQYRCVQSKICKKLWSYAYVNIPEKCEFGFAAPVNSVLSSIPAYGLSHSLHLIGFLKAMKSELSNSNLNEICGKEKCFCELTNIYSYEFLGRNLMRSSIWATLYFVLVLGLEWYDRNVQWIFNTKLCTWKSKETITKGPFPIMDPDVIKEGKRVDSGRAEADNLVVKHLKKCFPRMKVPAVSDLSFGVSKAEVFGLLGINGAGKTTTFNMLTGYQVESSGSAKILRNNLFSSKWDRFKDSSYCPQENTLFPSLTIEQHLELFAILRSIPKRVVHELTICIIKEVGLDSYKGQKAGQLSGGNQRKLNFALALLDYRPVIFLDEPTSGMDPGACRLCWSSIKRAVSQINCSVVLTSHSMDECEALCHRIGIMVAGSFMCIGSTQYLKNKFGDKYIFKIKLKKQDFMSTECHKIKTFIMQTLPSSRLDVQNANVLSFDVPCTHSFKLSGLIKVLSDCQKLFLVEDVSMTQTTLEQVFVNMAKHQDDLQLGSVVDANGRPVIFLDEPTSGMDPGACRLCWSSIKRAVYQRNCSVVLTSHSMDECEALCHRIGIMVAGSLVCIGSTQYLKNKFGDKYIFKIKLKKQDFMSTECHKIKTFIMQTLPSSRLDVQNANVLSFDVPCTHSFKLSGLIKVLSDCQKLFLVEDVSMTQTTLEQVFVNMAKHQDDLQLGSVVDANGRPVIFLDEPTSGMDPGACRLCWSSIKRAVYQRNCSVVLTSHSMDECEALCHRIGIMVAGSFVCIGSTQYLKNKFGDKYIFKIKLKKQDFMSTECHKIKTFIMQTLPSSRLDVQNANVLSFDVPCTHSFKLSGLIKVLSDCQKLFLVEDVSMTQTTLEQVFVNMAKHQDHLQLGSVVDANGNPQCTNIVPKKIIQT